MPLFFFQAESEEVEEAAVLSLSDKPGLSLSLDEKQPWQTRSLLSLWISDSSPCIWSKRSFHSSSGSRGVLDQRNFDESARSSSGGGRTMEWLSHL